MSTATIAHSCNHCHHHKKLEETKLSFFERHITTAKVMDVMKKVAIVAIGAFAAYTSMAFFAASFAFGAIVGVCISAKATEHKHHHHGHGKEIHADCSQGFVEDLTGARLPEPLAIASGVAITICHVDHHAHVFVPLVGVTLGFWCGQMAAPLAHRSYDKVASFFHKQPSLAMAAVAA